MAECAFAFLYQTVHHDNSVAGKNPTDIKFFVQLSRFFLSGILSPDIVPGYHFRFMSIPARLLHCQREIFLFPIASL